MDVAHAMCSSNPDRPSGAAPRTPGTGPIQPGARWHKGDGHWLAPPEPRRGALTWTPGPTICEAGAVGTAVCGGTWGCTCGCCTTIGARTCRGRSSDLQPPGQGWDAHASGRGGAPAASLADVCYQSTLTRGSLAVPTPASSLASLTPVRSLPRWATTSSCRGEPRALMAPESPARSPDSLKEPRPAGSC